MKDLDNILMIARMNGYSDVHLGGKNHIMMRNNGVLFPYEHSFSTNDVVNMILSMLNDVQKEKLKNGKDIDMVYVENGHRYRVNVYKERGELCAALRIIYEKIRSLGELHLPPVLHQLTKDHRGLVLLTGPTGSGKSTTLAAMINEVNQTRQCHILTIEDPIEYVYQQNRALIHQREVGFDVESFDIALRSAMREDPDVILVGEIRDRETAEIAIQASQTGHYVLSTIHTIDAIEVITRLRKMGVADYDIATTLATTISQRLVRTLCPKCMKERPFNDFEKEVIAKIGEKYGGEFDTKNSKTYDAVGCEYCNYSGYYGRKGIFEVVNITENIKEMIMSGASSIEIRKQAIKEGYKPLVVDGIQKVINGYTNLQEIDKKLLIFNNE